LNKVVFERYEEREYVRFTNRNKGKKGEHNKYRSFSRMNDAGESFVMVIQSLTQNHA